MRQRGNIPAPGLCCLRNWWLHLGLGRGRTGSTRAALGVPQAWTAAKVRTDLGHTFFQIWLYMCPLLAPSVCLSYKKSQTNKQTLGKLLNSYIKTTSQYCSHFFCVIFYMYNSPSALSHLQPQPKHAQSLKKLSLFVTLGTSRYSVFGGIDL